MEVPSTAISLCEAISRITPDLDEGWLLEHWEDGQPASERVAQTGTGPAFTEMDERHQKWRKRREPFTTAIIEGLKSGVLTAYGMQFPYTADGIVPIRRELWPKLTEIDSWGSRAHDNHGLIFHEIVVDHPEGRPSPKRSLEAATRPIAAEIDEENRTVYVGGEAYHFPGDVHWEIASRLVRADGKHLMTSRLLGDANSGSSTIKRAFRGNPDFERFSRHIQTVPGYAWFAPIGDDSIQSPP